MASICQQCSNFTITFKNAHEGSWYEHEFIFEAEGVTPMHLTPPEMIVLLNGLIEVQKTIKSKDIIDTYVKELDPQPEEGSAKILYVTKIAQDVKIQLLDYKQNVQVHKFEFDPRHDDVFAICAEVMHFLKRSVALHLKD